MVSINNSSSQSNSLSGVNSKLKRSNTEDQNSIKNDIKSKDINFKKNEASVNLDKLSEIKSKINSGTYKIDLDKLSSKMAKDLL